MIYDHIVLGSGPAGCAAASLLAKNGGTVLIVSRSLRWVANYGMWVDDIKDTWASKYLDEPYSTRWDIGESKYLDKKIQFYRPYIMLRNDKVQDDLLSHPNITVKIDEIKSVDRVREHVVCRNNTYNGRKIWNALGAMNKFTENESTYWKTHYQTAIGYVVKFKTPHNRNLSTYTLMDWNNDPTPSFAYIFPLDEKQLFIEETILIGPKFPFNILRNRLRNRLSDMLSNNKLSNKLSDRTDYEIIKTEYCVIPMGGLFSSKQYDIGAASGAISPISGYSVGYVWSTLDDKLFNNITLSRWRHEVDNTLANILSQLRNLPYFMFKFLSLPPSYHSGLLQRSSSPLSMIKTIVRFSTLINLSTIFRLSTSLVSIVLKRCGS